MACAVHVILICLAGLRGRCCLVDLYLHRSFVHADLVRRKVSASQEADLFNVFCFKFLVVFGFYLEVSLIFVRRFFICIMLKF